MSSKLRYACVGAGGIADKKHLNGYSKIKDVELAAICDIDVAAAEKMACKYGISNVFSSYSEMFERQPLDLVSICVPNYLHKPVTEAALKKGLHVHCEKPLALNANEINELISIKNASGKKVMVALNNRFTNEVRYMKQIAESGGFGEIYHIKCGWMRRNGIPGRGMWFTDRKLSGGGALIDLGVHYIDLAMYLLDFPEEASVLGATYSKFGDSDRRLRPGYNDKGKGVFDVEDMAVGTVRMKNGTTISFEFSWASNIEKECKYIEILGTQAGACFKDGELRLFSESDSPHSVIKQDWQDFDNPQNEFESFIYSIRNNTEPVCTPEEACKVMRIIDTVYAP